MNHSDIRELFEKRLNDACDAIRSAKNGSELIIKPSISYIDDKLQEKQTYNGYDSTSIVATAVIFEKNHASDEDPSYEISLLCDLKSGVAKNPLELEKELQNFDCELERFLTSLSSSENVFSLIKEEDDKINREGQKMVAELEASLAKMKKIGIIGGIIVLGALLIFTLIK